MRKRNVLVGVSGTVRNVVGVVHDEEATPLHSDLSYTKQACGAGESGIYFATSNILTAGGQSEDVGNG